MGIAFGAQHSLRGGVWVGRAARDAWRSAKPSFETGSGCGMIALGAHRLAAALYVCRSCSTDPHHVGPLSRASRHAGRHSSGHPDPDGCHRSGNTRERRRRTWRDGWSRHYGARRLRLRSTISSTPKPSSYNGTRHHQGVSFSRAPTFASPNAQITAISQTAARRICLRARQPPLILNYSASTVPIIQTRSLRGRHCPSRRSPIWASTPYAFL